jgi:type IV secretory pathway ATPase VirB11/archaellum biosynthesis ATPase
MREQVLTQIETQLNRGILPQKLELIEEFGQESVILYDELFSLNFLIHTHLNNKFLTEIFFHSPEAIEYHFLNGEIHYGKTSLSHKEWQIMLEILSLNFNQKWNYMNPFCSFNCQINNLNLRATLIHFSSTSKKQSKAFLRVLRYNPFNLKSFINDSRFLINCLSSKKNIIVSGPTGFR